MQSGSCVVKLHQNIAGHGGTPPCDDSLLCGKFCFVRTVNGILLVDIYPCMEIPASALCMRTVILSNGTMGQFARNEVIYPVKLRFIPQKCRLSLYSTI